MNALPSLNTRLYPTNAHIRVAMPTQMRLFSIVEMTFF
jgi:hypothetical protein